MAQRTGSPRNRAAIRGSCESEQRFLRGGLADPGTNVEQFREEGEVERRAEEAHP